MPSALIIALILLALSLAANLWLWRSRRSEPLATTEPEPNPLPPPAPTLADNFPLLFGAVAEALDAGMAVVSLSRHVVFLNARSEELLDTSMSRASGQSLIALVRDHQADTMVRDVLEDGEARETTLKPITSARTLRLRCTALHNADELVGCLLLIRDITQISMLERSRRDLVANVSHELRTPLASLKLLVETLQSTPPPAVAQRMLGQMADEIDAVTLLVDELYELAQIESGRVNLKLTPLHIEPVIERAMDRIRAQADRKQITLRAEPVVDSVPVLMDSDRIGQVLLNLLHNAVKFTNQGGEVALRSTLISIDGDDAEPDEEPRPAQSRRPPEAKSLVPQGHPSGQWIVLSVSDTGIGIPAQDLPRIFERFYKVDRSRNRNAGGTGLGLAIAKHLAEGHGGRLWVTSTEGQGSTFYVSLPVA
jgi:two-component system phosphate regulon sensor histidine kinase PhoR